MRPAFVLWGGQTIREEALSAGTANDHFGSANENL